MKFVFQWPWRVLVLIVAGLSSVCQADKPTESDPPNILFIVSDDQGPWSLGCAGNPSAHTPNLDRLRRQGVMLTQFYAPTPVCSPARAAMLTGRYGIEIGVKDAISAGDKEPVGVSPDLPNWPRALHAAGYRTALFGKYHCSRLPQSHPTKMGYDEFKGFVIGARISKDPEVEIDGEVRRVEGYTPDIITDFALDFLRRHYSRDNERSTARPFAMSLHFWAPHANTGVRAADGDRTWLPMRDEDIRPHIDADPILPGSDFANLDFAKLKRMYREYMASVTSLDRNVGRVLELLDELSLTDNTLVIFTSDHGMNMGHHGVWHKGSGNWLIKGKTGKRSNMWDTSLRVPALMRWPGVIEPGSTITQTLSHLDWFPTLVEIAGTKLPNSDAKIRGRSILQLLKGDVNTARDWNNDLYTEYQMQKDRGDGLANMRSFQTPKWKLVRFNNKTRPDEFYDRVNDPHEKQNLIDAHRPEVRNAIRQLNLQLDQRIREIYGD